MEEYSQRNSKGLWRYSVKNMELVKLYDDLIFNLFNGGNNGLVYDETTNTYTVKDIKNKVKKPIKSITKTKKSITKTKK